MSARPHSLPHPNAGMTVDEFIVWADGRPGRYELSSGVVVAMSPERARHALTKFAVQTALNAGVVRAGLACRMMPDGMTVRIDATTAYEPDALVHCGPPLDPDAVEVPDPVVIVEVSSPSTRHLDNGLKLAGYFRVASVMHYLLLDPVRRLVVHHRRGVGDLIETRIVADGNLDLTPPGMSLTVAELFADA